MGEEIAITYQKNKLIIIGLIVFSTIAVLSFTIYELITQEPEIKHSYQLPEWVKANAGWWSEGHLSDEEFSSSLQWLFDNGLIITKDCVGRCL